MPILYSSRRQSDERVKHIQAKGAGEFFSFAQRSNPCTDVLGKFVSVFHNLRRGPKATSPGLDNVGVAVLCDVAGLQSKAKEKETNLLRQLQLQVSPNLPSSAWLSTDTAYQKEIDPATMLPLGVRSHEDLNPELRGILSCAHPQQDPATGDWFNFNLETGPVTKYRVFRVNAATGQADILATITSAKAAYIHSFFLSEKYVVLCVPSTHYKACGARILWERNVLEAIKPFDLARKTQWFVVDRHHGRGVVAEFESDAGFFFHSVNAFDQVDGNGIPAVICDVIEYSSFDILHSLYYDVILDRDGAAAKSFSDPAKAAALIPRLTRYRLPLADSSSGKQEAAKMRPAERVCSTQGPRAGELPTINEAMATKPYTFTYSVPTRGLSTLVDAIAKTNVETGRAVLWAGPRGHTPGEPIFVARPEAVTEDDGVLLSVVLDGNTEKSYLLCLDAKKMEEMAAEAPFPIALGFHGVHVK